MKAGDLLRGYLQIKRIPLPLAGTTPALRLHGKTPEQKEADLEVWRAEHPGQPDPPEQPEVGLLLLEPHQSALVLQRAREFAISRGVEDPQPDDELYEYGKAIWTCLLGVVDPDTADDPSKSPEPFFDGGIDQLLSMRELGVDGIQILAKEHGEFTDEMSGQVRKLTDEEYQRLVKEAAGPDGYPFWSTLRPGVQWDCMRTTASLLHGSLSRSSSGGGDSARTTNSEPEPSSPTSSRSKAGAASSRKRKSRGSRGAR